MRNVWSPGQLVRVSSSLNMDQDTTEKFNDIVRTSGAWKVDEVVNVLRGIVTSGGDVETATAIAQSIGGA